MVDQYIDLCQTEGLTHSAMKRTDIDEKQQTRLAELAKDIKEMKEQYEKNIAKIRVGNKENTRTEIDNALSSYTGYHGKSKYGKTFASKLEDTLKPREVIMLHSYLGTCNRYILDLITAALDSTPLEVLKILKTILKTL